MVGIEALKFSRKTGTAIALLSLLVVGYVDFITGHELSLSAFYLLPISFVALRFGRSAGVLTAVISAVMETSVHILWGGFYYSKVLIHFWNMGILMAIYIVIALLIASLIKAYERERLSARKDFLTGIGNWQSFAELGGREIERAKRYNIILSLAYIDCDNFKTVNDVFGHETGDKVLREVAATLRENVRAADIVARLGGDEFVILLTDGGGAERAEIAVRKLQNLLLGNMMKNNWDVTFSIGIATFAEPPTSIESVVKQADLLMYEVKKTGRNAIKHQVFSR
jgi:diguanylate cyclase (GGDEF)-like protein